MLHPPTSENKQPTDSVRKQSADEREQELSQQTPALPEHASSRAADGRVPPPAPLKSAQHVAHLHSVYGNQAVLRMLSRSAPVIQTKLTVNQPGDQYEQEADNVADHVMGMTAPSEDKVQRKCAECEEEEKKPELQRKENGGAPAFAPPCVQNVLSSPGQPLDPAARAFMEPRFGHDFSQVRVHTGADAAESARAVNALAYTWDRHVVFGAAQHNPDSNMGRHLLAHELTHVVQQQSANPALQRQPASAPSASVDATATEVEDLVRPQNNEKAALEKLNGLDQNMLLLVVKKLYDDSAAAYAVDSTKDTAAFEKAEGKRRSFGLLNGTLGTADSPATKDVNVPRLKAAFDAALNAPAAGTAAPATTTAKRGSSSGATAAPSEEELGKKPEATRKKWQTWLDTRDAKVQEFGAADYEDYVQNMLVSGGSVFGLSIPAGHPVHPLFLDRLEAASQKAKAKMADSNFGIRAISGQDNRPGNHAWGLAVDIDADSNPYILNEAGEQKLDEVMAPIYERIAQALLHRSSVITPAAPGKPSGLEKATYTQLAEESDAMAAYFSVLSDEDKGVTPPKSDDSSKKAKKAPAPLPARRDLTGHQFDPADLQKLDVEQVKKDYATLKGGAPKGTSGDTPFTGGGPGKFRDPARGFLSIRKEVVEALRGEGLRWGATDFPGASGDVMHFDDQNRHSDYATYGKSNQTKKRKESGQN